MHLQQRYILAKLLKLYAAFLPVRVQMAAEFGARWHKLGKMTDRQCILKCSKFAENNCSILRQSGRARRYNFHQQGDTAC